jgi:hypothetical protein
MEEQVVAGKLKRLALVAVATLAFVGAVPASPASAGTCSTRGCGGIVYNNSSGLFRVANNWCWPDRTTWRGTTLSCASSWNAYAPNSFFVLGHPDTTLNYSFYYDTDAFRVDPNCVYYDTTSSFTYDNRGWSSPLWVKINNWSVVHINNIHCG